MKIGFTPDERKAILGLSMVLGARMLGFAIVLPVFSPYAVNELHASHAMAGLAFGANGLSQALLQVPFGMLGDRYGRRVTVGGGLLLFIVGCVLAALAQDIWTLTLGFFLQGSGAIASSLFAWVADTTDVSRRNIAMAALGISVGASIVLGFAIANPLAAAIGVPGIFWMCAGLSTFALLVVLVMPEPRPEARERGALAGGLGTVLRDFELTALNASGFIMNFTMRAVFFTVPLVLDQWMHKSQLWKIYLPLGIVGGMCMMAGSRMSDKGHARGIIVSSLGLMAIGFVLLGWFTAFTPVVAGFTAYFAGFSVLEALLPAAVSKLAEAEARGMTIGVYNTLQNFGLLFGSIAGGRLESNPQALFGLLLGMAVVSMLLCMRLRRVDQIGGHGRGAGRAVATVTP